MRVSYDQLKTEMKRVLLRHAFTEEKAGRCAAVFAGNSLDGVYSHGLNRFPVFVSYVEKGVVDPGAEPELIEKADGMEKWNGHSAPGVLNALHCMERAISLAKENGIGYVAIRNTNHWMRGGSYGWQAAEAGCIGICFTNAIAGMPPWGGKDPRLGNNPLVIAVPRKEGHIVLDMALSQFSYGKLQEYELQHKQLPFDGGYDEYGSLTRDPAAIRITKRALPIGFWKGSGLAMVLDIVLTALTGGRSTAGITQEEIETGVSQCFICINARDLQAPLIEEILTYTKTSRPATAGEAIFYPGENMLRVRKENSEKGIPVNEQIWQELLSM